MDSGDGEQRDGEYRTFSHPNFQRNAQSSTLFIPVEKLIHDWAGLSFQELLQKLEARELPSTTLLPSDTGSGSGAGENSPIPATSPVPSQHQFDLNSTPETQCFSFPTFAPITPDKSVISDNLNVDDTTDQERERDTTTTLKDQPKSLLATDLTKFQENQNPENVVSNEIDLNKTMQQKQRRKKHRPKVIAERKPRTPKPATPATKENPTGKRKYVRKKPKEIAPETPSKEAEQHGSGKRSPPQKKSCKRALNFDEMDAGDECTGCSYFNVNSEPNGHRLCTKSVSKVTVQLCQGIEEVTVRNTQAQITLENAAQGILDRDSRAFSTYPTDSDRSSTVNLTKGNEYKGNYSHAIKQASSGNIHMNGIHYNSAKAYHFISWQNNKKRRSDKGVNNIASNAAFYDAEKYFGAEATEKDSGVVLETYGQAQKGLQDGQTNGHIVIDLTAYERPTKKRSRNATKARDLASLAKMAPQAMANSHRTEQPESCIDALIAHTRATIAKRKRTKKRNLAVVQYSSMQKTYPSSGVPREVELAKMTTVEDIERQLKCLDINTESSTFTCPPENAIVPFLTRCQENNTLVLYQGAGMVVPFGPMTPIKKPRPRPKVDLDEETTRVWKLLLENINSEGIDGTDEQKAKWWEEERKVFRGRADSFIARMHLVQGDRRFSKWKGSVLDSVVGVFLTQNVSDHLSSSAFMSLAARYPIQSKNRNKACMVSDELQAYVSKNTRNWPASGSSFTPHDVEVMTLDAEDNEINEITGPDRKETLESNAAECCMELEEIAAVRLLSLQQCVDCSTSQTSNETGSCSESNSNVDDLANSCEPDSLEGSTSLLENLHVDEPTVVQEAYHGSDEMSSDTKLTETLLEAPSCPRVPCNNTLADKDTSVESQSRSATNLKNFEETTQEKSNWLQQNLQNHSDATQFVVNHTVKSDLKECGPSLSTEYSQIDAATSKPKSARLRKEKDDRDWDQLRKQAEANGRRQRTENTMDSLDWEALRCDDVDEVANTIKERGMNNKLARRIQDFLNRLVIEHGNTDLEWLRDVPPDQAKEYLLSIRGLGLKSVECVRLLTLHHLAFPVDTNVGRIAVRLGWVPLQPLPESLQLHLLELYPVLETIQKYLWPRLCKLDQRTLYELHYQMITFGKVFCTKSKPNCNSCPMRGECRHFASAFASARLALPGPEEKSIVPATKNGKEDANIPGTNERTPLSVPRLSCCEPIIEEPATPETECPIGDIEDFPSEDPDEIPTIKLNKEEFTQNLQNYMLKNMELQVGDMSKALVALDPEVASIPMPKLKNVNRLRTEHQVYELPDTHPLLERLQMEKREADDPSPYLLAIWTPGETPNSISPPDKRCCSQALGKLCNDAECFSCNSIREANSQTVRGTLLIPCRTAMRGSFPLNGTYFQVNEVFADNDSSLNPINVPRAWIWNLQRRTVYFGTSIPTIFRGLTTQGIQQCFWRGYVCVRGFDQKSRAPRPLMARLHFPASKGRRTRDPKADE